MKLHIFVIALTFFMKSTQINCSLKFNMNLETDLNGNDDNGGKEKCHFPFNYVDGVGCVFMYPKVADFTEARSRCNQLDSDLVVASDSEGRANLVQWVKLTIPSWEPDFIYWVGTNNGIWFNGDVVTDWVEGTTPDPLPECSPMILNTSGSLQVDPCTRSNLWFICQQKMN